MAMNTTANPDDTQQLNEASAYTVSTFFSSLIVAFAVFGGEVLAFMILNGGNPRI